MIVSSRSLFCRKNYLTEVLTNVRASRQLELVNNRTSTLRFSTPPLTEVNTPKSHSGTKKPSIIFSSSPSSVESIKLVASSSGTPADLNVKIKSGDLPKASLLTVLLQKYPPHLRNFITSHRFHVHFPLISGETTSLIQQIDLPSYSTVESALQILLTHLKSTFDSSLDTTITFYELKLANKDGSIDDDLPLDYSSKLFDFREFDFHCSASSTHPFLLSLNFQVDVDGSESFNFVVNGLFTGAMVLRLLEEEGVEVGDKALVFVGEVNKIVPGNNSLSHQIHVPPLQPVYSYLKHLNVLPLVYKFELVLPSILTESIPFSFNEKTVHEYKEFRVIKTNSSGVRQVRILGIDSTRIHNVLPQAHDVIKYLWTRTKPITAYRLIKEISHIEMQGKRGFVIHFIQYEDDKRERNSQVMRYEAQDQLQALEIVYRLRFLIENTRKNSP
ncbi:hypothetical protein RCL1_004394 [Eukaryota sp. TZLM3-RCL]